MKAGGMILIFVVGALSVACTGDRLGPCVHTDREPILLISSVRSGTSGPAIGTVYIDSLTLQDGFSPEREWFTREYERLTFEGDRYRCDVVCGFGDEAGTYRFRVTAPGHTPIRISVNADYREFHGGCPSWNDGGTRAAVTLPLSLPSR
jgi:hypothetical protein